jgi:hypothetical protein
MCAELNKRAVCLWWSLEFSLSATVTESYTLKSTGSLFRVLPSQDLAYFNRL